MAPLSIFLSSSPRHISVRQAAFYCLMFAGTGASLPFMPLWFRAHGMDAAQIGLILALPLLLRAITGPVSGLWADGFKLYRTPLIFLGAAALLFYSLLAAGDAWGEGRFWAFLLLWTLGYTAMTSVSPLMDSMTVYLGRKYDFAFGIPRGIGSAAFIVSNIAVGYWIQAAHPDVALWTVLMAMAGVAVGARFLLQPHPREAIAKPASPGAGLDRLMGLLRHPGYLPLLIAVACLQAAHSFYYAFSTIIWKDNGLSDSMCGWLWAVGVVAEIAFMGFGERIRRRLGPWTVLVLAGAFSVFRWGVMALSPSLFWLWPLQSLHVLSFAATYLAGLELVHRLTPKGDEALGQTVNAAYSNGVLMGIGTIASGGLYMAFGAGGYAVMAAMAAIGLGAAVWLYVNRARLMGQTDVPG